MAVGVAVVVGVVVGVGVGAAGVAVGVAVVVGVVVVAAGVAVGVAVVVGVQLTGYMTVKKTDIAILCACAFAVWATDGRAEVSYEIGTGHTSYRTDHDGIWYQEGHPHSLELDAVPASVGVSFKPNDIRYRVEYIALGEMFSKAQVSRDAEYYPGSSVPPSRWMLGRGSVSGIAMTMSRAFHGPFYAEAGAWVYKPKWQVTVYDIETNEPMRTRIVPDVTCVGPTVGLGFRQGSLDVSLRYFGMQQRTPERPPLVNEAYVMQFRFVF